MRVRCPVCGKTVEVAQASDLPTFPFCSPRCRLIDLGRWLGEEYRVPDDPADQAAAPGTVPGPDQADP
jgi:endogenous inhibitor of DNA gyrase (YacG/DUF329 family)